MHPILFADDTNIFLSGNNIDGIIDKMNGEIKKIIDWLDFNMLSLNIDKTHYIIFSSKFKKLKCNKQFYIREKPIKFVKPIKFLGVILDSRLTWFEHKQFTTRPRVLMLTCERIHLLFDLSCKFESF